MRKLLGIFALCVFFFYMLFSTGCATTKANPEEGPCVPGEIVFGIDPGAWKRLGNSSHMARPIYIYVCVENDELHALGLEAFYDGQRYQLFGKTYEHLNGFKDFTEMRDFIVDERSKIKEQIKE